MFILLIILYFGLRSSFIIKNNNKLNILNIKKNKYSEELSLNEFSKIKKNKKENDFNSTETFQNIMPPKKPISPLIQSSLLFLDSKENNLENNLICI
jgi:hypothetical protein